MFTNIISARVRTRARAHTHTHKQCGAMHYPLRTVQSISLTQFHTHILQEFAKTDEDNDELTFTENEMLLVNNYKKEMLLVNVLQRMTHAIENFLAKVLPNSL